MSVLEEFKNYSESFLSEEDGNITHSVRIYKEDEFVDYDIPHKELKTFLEAADTIISKAEVLEKIPENTPAFFSYKIPYDDEKQAISDDFLIKLVNFGKEALKANLETDNIDENCVVLRSPPYNRQPTEKEKRRIKTGEEINLMIESILLIYPKIIVKRDPDDEDEDSFLQSSRNTLIKIYNEYYRTSDEDKEYIIDDILTNKDIEYLPIYGSSQKNVLARRFYCGFNESNDKLNLEEVFNGRESEYKTSYLFSFQRMGKKPEITANIPPHLLRLQTMISLLSADRAKSKADQVIVAQAIHYESKHSSIGLEILEDFLDDRELAKELWQTVVTLPERYKMKSIRYMVSIDSPERLQPILLEELRQLMLKSISPTGSDLHIAEILKILYGHLFVTDLEGKWYVYRDTHWEENGEIEMRNYIRNDLIPLYENFHTKIPMQGASKAELQKNKDAMDKCITLLKKLGSHTKNTILKEAEDLFVDQKLHEKLDGPISYHTFAFADCVFDLKTCTLTDGKPEDFCMNHSKVYMRDNTFHMGHKDVKEVINFFKMLHKEEDLIWWRIDRYACCLEGGNRYKQLTINEGKKANNGKSTEEYLTKEAFGEYAGTAPTSLIVGTKRTEANGPTVAYKHIQGKRLIFIQEVVGRENLNAGVLKELSSGIDALPVRGPYERKMIEVVPSYKMFIVCNNAPKVPPSEVGVYLRARISSYNTVFDKKEKVPPTEEEQWEKMIFPIKADMNTKIIPRMVAPFMWLLMERYKIWRETGPEDPPIITELLEEFKFRNDTYGRFIIDRVEDDEESYLNLEDMYDEFTKWFKTKYPGSHQPSSDDLGEYMKIKYSDREEFEGSYKGMRLKILARRRRQ